MLKQISIVERLREVLLSDLAAQSLEIGDRIPAEIKLAETYQVSRNTVREVVIQLESEGMVARCHGVGTILRRSPKSHMRAVSIPDMIRRQGKAPGVEQISVRHDLIVPEVAEKFRIDTSAPLMQLERVLTADGKPISVITDYLPQDRADKWNVEWPNFDGDLIRIFAEKVGTERFLQNASVSAVSANKTLAGTLRCAPGSALVKVSTNLFSEAVELLAVSRLLIMPGSVPLEFAGAIHASTAP